MKCPRCDFEITGIREICPQCGDSVSVAKDIVQLTHHSSFCDWSYSRKAIWAVIFTILRFFFYHDSALGMALGGLGLFLAIVALIEISMNKDRIIGKCLAVSAIFNFVIYYFLYTLCQPTGFFQ